MVKRAILIAFLANKRSLNRMLMTTQNPQDLLSILLLWQRIAAAWGCLDWSNLESTVNKECVNFKKKQRLSYKSFLSAVGKIMTYGAKGFGFKC